jgi:steroid 5-alpha reductase family enzyme
MSNNIHRPSRTALLLGFGGLIPFVGLSSLCIFTSGTHQQTLLFSLLAYGATIISFLGAIHWGLAMRAEHQDRIAIIWGVIPSLVAWGSLIVDTHLGLAIQFITLWVCFFVDLKRYPQFGVSEWLSLRLQLTLIAGISLVLPALVLKTI